MGAVTYPTLEHVAMEARPYPTDILKGAETGLVLFAAAFMGHNDSIWFAEAGIQTTCVDVDSDRLDEMRDLYPLNWRLWTGDAWDFAREAANQGEQWDVVSLDPWTGEMMERVQKSLPLWFSLARKAVVVGTSPGYAVRDTDEWKLTTIVGRSSIADWYVWERQC